MKPFSSGRPPSIIEVLESRIAPAHLYLVGVPNTSDYKNSASVPFVATALPTSDPIALAVGGDDHSFYLKMSAGDKLNIYTTSGGSEQTFLAVGSGNLVAFFEDKNQDNLVQATELTGLSLGNNAAFVLNGSLNGDIISNLDDHAGISSATISMASLVSANQTIKAIQANSVSGKIIAGGDIKQVSVFNAAGSILAGDAAHNATFNFFGGVAGSTTGKISFAEPDGHKGASISKVTVGALDLIHAGGGGVGAAGGSITNVQITKDATGYSLIAGDGGEGSGAKAGGVGGSISTILVTGTPPPNGTQGLPNAEAKLHAGSGGDSLGGKGGNGGSLTNILVGFQLVAGKPQKTDQLSQDDVQIYAGDGGDGKTGGLGGSVTKSTILTVSPPEVPGIDNLSPLQTLIQAGDGGGGSVKAGNGGSLTTVEARDVNLTQGSQISLLAGHGGVAGLAATGGNGGTVKSITILGTNLVVAAGNGSDGTKGGIGGAFTDVVVLGQGSILANTGIFNAGHGGDGSVTTGGAGGNFSKLNVNQADFAALAINKEISANGGSSFKGVGAKGGTVDSVKVNDIDSKASLEGLFTVRGGNGGNGSTGGGAGGALSNLSLDCFNLSADIESGDGGSSTGTSGKGGVGGDLKTVSFTTAGGHDLFAVNTKFVAGDGGTGTGTGAGGAGGSYSLVNVNLRQPTQAVLPESNLEITAGDGGSSTGTGASGKGGSIVSSGGFNELGSASFLAGDAGLTGGKAGAGGAVIGSSQSKVSGLYALANLTVIAGNGSEGGAGGAIRFFGYGSPSATLVPTPFGNITIQAGNGSQSPTTVGAGGSIDNLSGSVSSGDNKLTKIVAGNGGGNDTKSAAGGSVTNLIIQLGGAFESELRIDAGDAGDGLGATKKGAAGGSVSNVGIGGLDSGTIIRHVAAGDGGNAGGGKGGNGGSVTGVFARDLDIGVRSGEFFGYNEMGGVFAGTAGTSKAGTEASPGNVIGITASAIAAIVAGKGEIPQAAGLVQSIYVGTSAPSQDDVKDLLKDSDHDLVLTAGGTYIDPVDLSNWHAFKFNAYQTNNLVGAVAQYSIAGANKFRYYDANGDIQRDGKFELGLKPVDGLILAHVFNYKLANFTPEAMLTGDAAALVIASDAQSASGFYDYNNLV